MSTEDAGVGSLDSLGGKANFASYRPIYLKRKNRWKLQQLAGKILRAGGELGNHLLL